MYRSRLFLLCEQRLKLIPADLLLLQQKVRAGVKHIFVFHDDILCLLVAVVHDRLHLDIDLARDRLRVASRVRQIPADEHFIVVLVVVDDADIVGESVLCHHCPRHLGRLLDVARSAGRHVVKNDLLRNTPAE